MADIEVLLSEEQIAARIKTLASEILAVYGDEPITVICVLKGATIFASDLLRALGPEHAIEFLGVSSYKGTKSTGHVRITHDLAASLEGKHCLVVEDIVDTGLTLAYIVKSLSVRGPASLRVASLLDKPSRRQVPVHVDFTGFTIEDRFVIGYGLDLDQRFRGLPYIGIYGGE